MQSMALKVKVTLQLTVSQSVCFGVEPLLGLMTRSMALENAAPLETINIASGGSVPE
jgi:hypothetical protein